MNWHELAEERGYAPRRRPHRPGYRVEWRRLRRDVAGVEFTDVRYEVGEDPVALRAFALSVAGDALGYEFRVSSPQLGEVVTCLDGLRRWDAAAAGLPPSKSSSIWDAELRVVVLADRALTIVREAMLTLANERVMTAADALLVVAFARSLVGRSAT